MTRPLSSLLLLVASLAAAAEAPAPRPALTVTTVRPAAVEWPLTLAATGGLYPWQEAVIAAETGGLRVVELSADVGSVVRKGETLALLAPETVEAALAQRRAEVAQARAALAEARADARRAREVKGAGALSEQKSEQYLIAEEKAGAAVAAAEAALRAEEIRLRQTRIAAVDDGVIAVRSATLGAVVQAGTELFRLVRQGRVEWRAEVTAEQLGPIRAGQEVRLYPAGAAAVAGRVRQVAPTIDPATRKGLVYVDLDNGAAAPVRAGMFARGEILFGRAPALALPASAVVLRDGFSYLFEVTPEGTVHRRKVTTGRIEGGQVEIVAGAEPGMTVVRSGGAFLAEGDRVRLEAEAAP